jgi:hypothetical protein
MSIRLVVGLLAIVASSCAHAICIIEDDLESTLTSAEIVYIGTVVESALVPSLGAIRDRSRPEVRHIVTPQISLRGNPSDVPDVISFAGYSDPESGKIRHFSELVRVGPGDTILVVGKAGEPSYINLCSASGIWDADTQKAVRKVFPSAP